MTVTLYFLIGLLISLPFGYLLSGPDAKVFDDVPVTHGSAAVVVLIVMVVIIFLWPVLFLAPLSKLIRYMWKLKENEKDENDKDY